jgi:hypothetical protein
MFEKEAEEYIKKDGTKAEQILSLMQGKIKVKIKQIPFILAAFQQTYQDGAEFGYNKANEWHYVKEGDLPKETGLLMSKTLLLVTKMKGSDCLSLALGEYNFSTQEFSYQHIIGLTDVIAWKEIVLPKEIKEK